MRLSAPGQHQPRTSLKTHQNALTSNMGQGNMGNISVPSNSGHKTHASQWGGGHIMRMLGLVLLTVAGFALIFNVLMLNPWGLLQWSVVAAVGGLLRYAAIKRQGKASSTKR